MNEDNLILSACCHPKAKVLLSSSSVNLTLLQSAQSPEKGELISGKSGICQSQCKSRAFE